MRKRMNEEKRGTRLVALVLNHRETFEEERSDYEKKDPQSLRVAENEQFLRENHEEMHF
jgi:hypothetical protein